MKNLSFMHLGVLILFTFIHSIYGQNSEIHSIHEHIKTYRVSIDYNVSYIKTAQQNYFFKVSCSDETKKCSLHFKVIDQNNQLLFDVLFSDQYEPMLNELGLYSNVTGKTLEEVLPAISSCKELDSLFASLYNSYLIFSEKTRFDEVKGTYSGYTYHYATPLVFLTKSVLKLSLLLKEKANGVIDHCQRDHQSADEPILFWNSEMCPIAKINSALDILKSASSILGLEFQIACLKNDNNESRTRPILLEDSRREVYLASSASKGCPGYIIADKLRQYANMYESAQEQYKAAWYAK